MNYLRVGVLIILLAIAVACTTDAPDATDIPASDDFIVVNTDLVVFTLPDTNLSGVAPADWEEVQIGSYIRNQEGDNSTYLLHIASQENSLEVLLQPILAAFSQDQLPSTSQSYDGGQYGWSLYSFEYSPFPDRDDRLAVDIATVESENLAAIIVLQSHPDEHDVLEASVFHTALNYFGQDLASIEADLGIDNLVPTVIDFYDVQTLIPKDWENVSEGSYIRGDLQTDPTTIIIQTSSDLSETEFRDLFLEQLQINIDSDSETYASDVLAWTIHNVDINLEGTLLTWQIATASDTNYAYLVVLFSFTEEVGTLRDSIFLPILNATQASR